MDLEGIVCKQKESPYKVTEKPSRYWIKIKNPNYSRAEGRGEMFDGFRDLATYSETPQENSGQ